MPETKILKCPHCGAGQGEIGSKITYRRKRGAVHFELQGEFQIDCYGCFKSRVFKKSLDGDLVLIK